MRLVHDFYFTLIIHTVLLICHGRFNYSFQHPKGSITWCVIFYVNFFDLYLFLGTNLISSYVHLFWFTFMSTWLSWMRTSSDCYRQLLSQRRRRAFIIRDWCTVSKCLYCESQQPFFAYLSMRICEIFNKYTKLSTQYWVRVISKEIEPEFSQMYTYFGPCLYQLL